MAGTPARTCSVSIGRMGALADELRLFKAQIAVMQGRLDFVLAEIAAELEGVRVSAVADSEEDSRQPMQDNQPNDKPAASPDSATRDVAAEPPATLDGEARGDTTHIDTPFPSGPEVLKTVESGGEIALVHDVDAARLLTGIGASHPDEAPPIDVPTDADTSREIEGSSVAPLAIAVFEDSRPAEGAEARILIRAATVVTLPDNACAPASVVETLAPASPFPWNVRVLGTLRQQATLKSHAATVKVGRWVALIALTMATVAAAAVGSGLATLETRPGNPSFGQSVRQPVSRMPEIWRLRAAAAFQ